MKKIVGLCTLPILFGSLHAYAVTQTNLNNEPISILSNSSDHHGINYQELNRAVDFKQTIHVRLAQTYQDIPVWGAQAIVHAPHSNARTSLNELNNSTVTGQIYQQFDRDLKNTRATVFNDHSRENAIATAIQNFHSSDNSADITNAKAETYVYIDKQNTAHWTYLVSFDVSIIPGKAAPKKMKYMIDAVTQNVYLQWNDLKTFSADLGGGFGGNKKMGKVTYDGLAKNLPTLHIDRDPTSNTCYLRNDSVTVKDRRKNDAVVNFNCGQPDKTHNNVYWNGANDAIHGAYSPSNDALYEGAIIKTMYQKWYNLNVLEKDSKPMMLNMIVHEKMDNAYWDGEQMTFGDGIILFYPLTSLDVASHEISHGFTEQHSGLIYEGQSGGLNESFSDMAGKAAEYFSFGTNNWKIGSQIFWLGDALRYMDKPSKDCTWWSSTCSIDDAEQYRDNLDVHYTSGVYNRFFYLLATTPGWDTKKAFDVVVQANLAYWTPTATFESAACGVLQAASDYKYDVSAVKNALTIVKINYSQCN